jgi:hypothetical protein
MSRLSVQTMVIETTSEIQQSEKRKYALDVEGIQYKVKS